LARLGPIAAETGLLSPAQRDTLERRIASMERLTQWLHETNARPAEVNELLTSAGQAPISEPVRLSQLLKRPHVDAAALAAVFSPLPCTPGAETDEMLRALEMEIRYEGYLARERERAEALRRQTGFRLPSDLPYDQLLSISTEGRQKLARVQPSTLGQAARVPGVSQSDLQNLMMEVRKRHQASRTAAS
jgi:tRNA uridine 5-carboxymethylaminomethyl modification enzyme